MTNVQPTTEFKFLPDIPIDIDHTLYQLLRSFQSVRDGLPELPKNSKDQYSRLGVTAKKDRQIVILVNSKTRSIGVLDFAGAGTTDFKQWQTWSDPAANRAKANSDIEGGHGNGGKAFMVWGSLTDSFLESVVDGKRTKMGYKNDQKNRRHYPAYIAEDGVVLDGVSNKEPRSGLDAVLRRFRATFANLPKDAQRVFESRKAFTVVEVNSIRDWSGRRPATLKNMISELPMMLRQHPQMALTLESCTVSILVDGKIDSASPLSVVYPDAMKGFEDIPRLPIPEKLADPETGDEVNTGGSSDDYLELRTSKRHLRQTDKTLNVLRVRNSRNVVANLSVAELAPQNESAFLFGTLRLASIDGEHLSGSDRKGLADTSLTRAIKQWASEQIEALASKLQKALAKEHKQQDRDRANESLSRMRELMREYLEPDEEPGTGNQDNGDRGDGPGGVIIDNPPRQKGERVDQVILEPDRTAMSVAVGTTIPLRIRCYQLKDGDQLSVPVHPSDLAVIRSSDAPECALTEHGTLHVTSAGKGRLAIRHEASGIVSNEIELDGVSCGGADIVSVDRLLFKGERVNLTTVFHTPNGPRQDLLIEGLIDEMDRGRISRTAQFTAGRQEGPVTVRVRFGPKPTDFSSVQLRIGPESMPVRGRGGSAGGGNIPYILLCGTEAPGMDDLPPEQRTHHGGEIHPTIIEEPPFDNVVWINPNSKEALRVRHGRGGTKGSAGIATKTFTQFVALKAFDILKRLRVRQAIGEASVSELQFRNELAMAEMACADFVDAAYDIASNLAPAEE